MQQLLDDQAPQDQDEGSLQTRDMMNKIFFLDTHTEGSNMPGLPLRCSCSTCKSWIIFNLVSKVMAVLMMYWYQQQPQPCKPTLSLFTWAGSPRKPDESQLWQAYGYCNYISQHRLKGIQVMEVVQTYHSRRLNWTEYHTSKSRWTTFTKGCIYPFSPPFY